MAKTVMFGRTITEQREAKRAMPKSDYEFRRKYQKKYFCAKCNEELTVYEHMKFLFMCIICAQNGDAHYEQWGNKVYLTNRGK